LSRSLNTIRILDLVFITEDTDGIVEAVDFEVHGDVALFHGLDGEVGGFISDISYARRGARAEIVGRRAELAGPVG
jgi:hypothetical protein